MNFRLLIAILFITQSVGLNPAHAADSSLSFQSFLTGYLKSSESIVSARQRLSQADYSKEIATDVWQNRLNLVPAVNFEDRTSQQNPFLNQYTRTKNIRASVTQQMPTGTTLQVEGQEFIEKQNPLLSSYDSIYSASLTQDLVRNTFGRTQRARANKARTDFEIAGLEYQQAIVQSCQEAFNLYADTYIQQQRWNILKQQLRDAKKARDINRRLHKDRLIQKIDLLSSESDYLQSKIQADQALQLLANNKRQLEVFIGKQSPFTLTNPKGFLGKIPQKKQIVTLTQQIAEKRLDSQELEVDRVKTDRWSDVQLGIEVGRRKGRFAQSGIGLSPVQEDYLNATVTFSFDLINKSEDGELTNALNYRNQFAIQNEMIAENQTTVLKNLFESQKLLSGQVTASQARIDLLEEKAKMAFQQMKKARIDFENYLLHRNSFRNQQMTHLNYQKDLWLNHFALKRENMQEGQNFCQGAS